MLGFAFQEAQRSQRIGQKIKRPNGAGGTGSSGAGSSASASNSQRSPSSCAQTGTSSLPPSSIAVAPQQQAGQPQQPQQEAQPEGPQQKHKRTRRRRRQKKKTGVGAGGVEGSISACSDSISDMSYSVSISAHSAGGGGASISSAGSGTSFHSGSNYSNPRRIPNHHPKSIASSSNGSTSKKHHDAPMTKRDLYFCLRCGMVGLGSSSSMGRGSDRNGNPNSTAVGRVTVVNWDGDIVLDRFVKVPVPYIADYQTQTTGITPEALQSPQALTFEQARKTVESLIKGKILIGHGLEVDLAALGLSHPWCDVRDTANYAPYMKEITVPTELDDDPAASNNIFRGVNSESTGSCGVMLVPRDLTSLVMQVLSRSQIPVGPVQEAFAIIELYKAVRHEWEAELIKLIRQKERQRELVLKMRSAALQRVAAVGSSPGVSQHQLSAIREDDDPCRAFSGYPMRQPAADAFGPTATRNMGPTGYPMQPQAFEAAFEASGLVLTRNLCSPQSFQSYGMNTNGLGQNLDVRPNMNQQYHMENDTALASRFANGAQVSSLSSPSTPTPGFYHPMTTGVSTPSQVENHQEVPDYDHTNHSHYSPIYRNGGSGQIGTSAWSAASGSSGGGLNRSGSGNDDYSETSSITSANRIESWSLADKGSEIHTMGSGTDLVATANAWAPAGTTMQQQLSQNDVSDEQKPQVEAPRRPFAHDSNLAGAGFAGDPHLSLTEEELLGPQLLADLDEEPPQTSWASSNTEPCMVDKDVDQNIGRAASTNDVIGLQAPASRKQSWFMRRLGSTNSSQRQPHSSTDDATAPTVKTSHSLFGSPVEI